MHRGKDDSARSPPNPSPPPRPAAPLPFDELLCSSSADVTTPPAVTRMGRSRCHVSGARRLCDAHAQSAIPAAGQPSREAAWSVCPGFPKEAVCKTISPRPARGRSPATSRRRLRPPQIEPHGSPGTSRMARSVRRRRGPASLDLISTSACGRGSSGPCSQRHGTSDARPARGSLP